MKSDGNRSWFRFTCCLNAIDLTAYSLARSQSSITLIPRMSKTFEAILSSERSDMDAPVFFMIQDQDT